MDYLVKQEWNGYKVGDVITDPFTDEFNLLGQVAAGVLEISTSNTTTTQKVEEAPNGNIPE